MASGETTYLLAPWLFRLLLIECDCGGGDGGEEESSDDRDEGAVEMRRGDDEHELLFDLDVNNELLSSFKYNNDI